MFTGICTEREREQESEWIAASLRSSSVAGSGTSRSSRAADDGERVILLPMYTQIELVRS